jgi:hypothetical protein
MPNRGVLKSVSSYIGYAFVEIKYEEVDKTETLYFPGWDEGYTNDNPLDMCYVFDAKPGAGKNKPTVIKETWSFALPEDQYLLGIEQQALDLYHAFLSQLYKLPSTQRKQVYEDLYKGKTESLLDAMRGKEVNAKSCVQDSKTLFSGIKDCQKFLQDSLFSDIVSSCKKISKWLCWNSKTKTSMNLTATSERWHKLLDNPYHIVYGLAEGEAKLLRQIKGAETSRLDAIFLNHKKVKPEEDIRVEYWIFDSINHGQGNPSN